MAKGRQSRPVLKQDKKQGAARGGTSSQEAKASLAALSVVEENALSWINIHLRGHRGQVLYCKAQLEAGMCDKSVESHDVEQKEVFHHTYTTFKSLPKYWQAEFLHSTAKLPKELLDLIDYASPGQIRQAFTHITGISEFMWWPPPLHRIELLTDFARGQLKLHGNRHIGFASFVSATGDIDWMKAMKYKLDWAGTAKAKEPRRLTHIKYDDDEKVAVETVIITDAFVIMEPWDDMRSSFSGSDEVIKPFLHSFFKGAMWRDNWQRPYFKKAADELERRWYLRQQSMLMGSGDVILTKSAARAKAKAKHSAKGRVPAHRVATPMNL